MMSIPRVTDALLEVDGRVALLTLNRDDVRNALTGRLVGVEEAKALRLAKRLMKMAQRMELKDFLDLGAAFQGMCHNEAQHPEAVHRMLKE